MILPLTTSLQYMDIVQYPNHFYEFIFKSKSPTRRAFDNWITGVEQIYNLPLDTPIKLLTNVLQVEGIPLTYAFQQSQIMLKRHPQHPKLRSVFLMSESQGIIDKMLQSFAQLLRTGDEIRNMYGDKREQAIDWLFTKEPHHRPQHPEGNA